MSQDLETTLNSARQEVLAGKQLPLEKQAELLKLIRANRFSAAEAGNASRTKKASSKKELSDSDLDAQLGDLGL